MEVDKCCVTAEPLLCEDCSLHAPGGDCTEAQHCCQEALHQRPQWQGDYHSLILTNTAILHLVSTLLEKMAKNLRYIDGILSEIVSPVGKYKAMGLNVTDLPIPGGK